MRTLIIAVMIVIGATASLEAREIYVDNVGGDDLHIGTSPAASDPDRGPCRTIARALRLAVKGDTVVLANTGVPYRESITLQGARHSGSPADPWIIEGSGAILEGAEPVIDAAWEFYQGDVFRFKPDRPTFHQLFHDGAPLTRRAVSNAQGELPELEPLEWTLLNSYLYFRVEQDRLPHDYRLTHSARRVGITLYDVRNVVVRNLIVQGFQLDGVNCHDNVYATLAELTCRGNGRSGISVGGASRVRVESCLVGNNGAVQLRTEGYCRVEVVGSDLIDNTAPATIREGGFLSIDGEVIEQ